MLHHPICRGAPYWRVVGNNLRCCDFCRRGKTSTVTMKKEADVLLGRRTWVWKALAGKGEETALVEISVWYPWAADTGGRDIETTRLLKINCNSLVFWGKALMFTVNIRSNKTSARAFPIKRPLAASPTSEAPRPFHWSNDPNEAQEGGERIWGGGECAKMRGCSGAC